MLVLVLGVSAIVGVIGLSSLLAVRLQHRDAEVRADATQAAILADSGLKVVHAQLSAQSDWRTTHTHDTWNGPTNLGNGAMSYKLVDEGDDNDGDLADDQDDPARLIVRVAFGDAVRLASIQLAGGDPLGPELVTNGDMESGSSPYVVTIGTATVSSHSDQPHGGTYYNKLTGRLSSISAWKQNLDGLITESGKTYRVSAWVRNEDSDVDTNVGLFTRSGLDADYLQLGLPTNTATWTYFEIDATTDFVGTLAEVYVYGSTATTNQDMHFDDVSVREVLAGHGLPLVRGSYRRELNN